MTPRYGIVYQVVNKFNGKCYVGQTTGSLQKRWREHCNNARAGRASKLYAAIRKHGSQAFLVNELLPCLTKSDLNAAEIYWIAYYDCTRTGYNTAIGGEGNKGRVVSAASRARMSVARTGLKHSAETRAKLSAQRKGRVPTQASKEKVAAALRGRVRPPEVGLRISAALREDPTTRTRALRAGLVNAVSIQDQYGNVYISMSSAASKLSVARSDILQVLNRKRNHVKGYIFTRVK